MTIGLLIVRLVFGITVVVQTVQKLFDWFGGGGFGGTAPFMEQLGFRGQPPAVLAGFVEASGGVMLAAGFFSLLAAAMIFSLVLVHSLTSHLANGFFVRNGCERTVRSRRGAGLGFDRSGRIVSGWRPGDRLVRFRAGCNRAGARAAGRRRAASGSDATLTVAATREPTLVETRIRIAARDAIPVSRQFLSAANCSYVTARVS